MEDLPKEFSIPADEKILMEFRREYNSFIAPYVMNAIITIGVLLVIFTILNIIVFVPMGYEVLPLIMWTWVNFWQVWLILIVFIIALGVVLVPLIGYYYTKSFRYYVTNKRLIVYWKFLFIMIRETKIDKVTDLTVSQSIWGRVFSYGTVNPITPGLQMKMPGQAGSSSGMASAFSAFGGGSSRGGAESLSITGFSGVKDPFYTAYKFKSIDTYGEIK